MADFWDTLYSYLAYCYFYIRNLITKFKSINPFKWFNCSICFRSSLKKRDENGGGNASAASCNVTYSLDPVVNSKTIKEIIMLENIGGGNGNGFLKSF